MPGPRKGPRGRDWREADPPHESRKQPGPRHDLAELTARGPALSDMARRRSGEAVSGGGTEAAAEVRVAVPPGLVERTVSLPRGHPVFASLAVLLVVAGAALAFTLDGASDRGGDDGASPVVVDAIPNPPRSDETSREPGLPGEVSEQPTKRATLGSEGEEAVPNSGMEGSSASAEDAMPKPSARPTHLEGYGEEREMAEEERATAADQPAAEGAESPEDAPGETSPAAADATSLDTAVPTPEQVAALVERGSAAAAYDSGEGIAPEHSNNLVAKVQRALLWRGFDPGPVDGRLGDRTQAAVRAFQRKIGVEADGQVDIEVLRQLNEIETAPGVPVTSAVPRAPGDNAPEQVQFASASPFDTPPDEGPSAQGGSTAASGAAYDEDGTEAADRAEPATVLAVQRALRRQGYDPGPVDGVEGAQTRAAVRSYQRQNGLAGDGNVDPALLDHLRNTSVETSRKRPRGSLEDRVMGAVDSVAKLFGLQVEGSVDTDFATPKGSRGAR